MFPFLTLGRWLWLDFIEFFQIYTLQFLVTGLSSAQGSGNRGELEHFDGNGGDSFNSTWPVRVYVEVCGNNIILRLIFGYVIAKESSPVPDIRHCSLLLLPPSSYQWSQILNNFCMVWNPLLYMDWNPLTSVWCGILCNSLCMVWNPLNFCIPWNLL